MRSIYFVVTSFLLSCLTVFSAAAQTISIPDAHFKEVLITLGHDTNGDGQIQKAEALKITRLYINKADITSLAGIKNFSNLEEFGFYDNTIRTLDLEGMTKLRAIYGWNNGMTMLKVKGCTKLETFYMNDNSLRVIDLTGLSNLKELKLERNMLERIDISNFPKLEIVDLDYNKIAEFKATGSYAIRELKLRENYLFELDLKPFTKLELAYLTDNPLNKIDVRGLKFLQTLWMAGRKYPSNITQLNTCGLVSLRDYDW